MAVTNAGDESAVAMLPAAVGIVTAMGAGLGDEVREQVREALGVPGPAGEHIRMPGEAPADRARLVAAITADPGAAANIISDLAGHSAILAVALAYTALRLAGSQTRPAATLAELGREAAQGAV